MLSAGSSILRLGNCLADGLLGNERLVFLIFVGVVVVFFLFDLLSGWLWLRLLLLLLGGGHDWGCGGSGGDLLDLYCRKVVAWGCF